MVDGVKTTDFTPAAAVDELIGNKTVDDIPTTVRVPIADLATQLAATGAIADAIAGLADSAPIFVSAKGQSNMNIRPSFSPDPWEPNLLVWNHDGDADGATHVGTAFAAPANNIMNTALAFANELAKDNPTRTVYLVITGGSARPIAKWMAGSPVPDLYASDKANVEAALAVAGMTTVSIELWWQGESDALAGSTTYASDFETVRARYAGETWLPDTTPLVIFGTAHVGTAAVTYMNDTLRQIVRYDPNRRTYVDSGSYRGAWTGAIDVTGAGALFIGRMGYRTYAHGVRNGFTGSPWHTVWKKLTQSQTANAALVNDADLQFHVKNGRTYKVRGVINGMTNATPDFKWGFSGPTFGTINSFLGVIKQDAPTVESLAVQAPATTLVTNQTILVGSSSQTFQIRFEMLLNDADADGIVRFQWCQNTSDAALTYVFLGSYIEVLDVDKYT